MEFRVLGALEVGPGGAALELGPPKQRALLAILLLHVGEIVPVDRLIDLLWGDDPPRTAGHSIQIYISELRKVLEPLAGRRLIARRQPGYQLDAPGEDVDASRFETLVREGSAHLAVGQRDEGAKKLRAALELWRGPALSDFAYEEFAQTYIRRLNDIHLDAIEELAASELEGGQAAGVVGLLEAAIREDPLRERSRELLMVALYRTGRHAEALRTYERLREQLVEELGLEPSPPLQQLRDRVLLHDPTLQSVGPAEPARGTERNPYKGLQSFSEADAEDFFGREALVARLLDSIANGQRLVALVGPSGSGKSSMIAAGVIPRLRNGGVPGSDRWIVINVPLGADPLGDLQTLLARVAHRPQAARQVDGSALLLPPLDEGGRVVLVMDQFEVLFTLTEEGRRDQFLAELARAVQDDQHQPIVILGLRADYYDRPLQHAEFSEVFVPGVVHVLPMSPHELQASIAEPAERVGVAIESKLLAELVADSAARPGSLPLLQYALTELFEQRAGTTLTMASYNALGGLRGVLSRRAEATFLSLPPAEQRVAIQVFLRLVRLGRGTADSRRRLVVSELTGLGIDSVVLSAVLLAFSRHRLLTFDRDEVSGEATVELAHEALLTEWERLAGWIDRHRAALRRRDALLFAVDEWELAGRDPEYLLSGTRLTEFETWRQESSLQLSRNEIEFLDASVEHRETDRQADEVRRTETTRLVRSARRRLIGLGAAGVAAVGLGGALIYGIVTAPPPPLAPVAYAWLNDGLVAKQALIGFDAAVTEFGLVGQKFGPETIWKQMELELGPDWWVDMSGSESKAAYLRAAQDDLARIADRGTGLIVVDGLEGADIVDVASSHPTTKFAIGNPGVGPLNVAFLTSIDSEPSYLAGAAAALTTKTGTIGFIGGVDWEVIWGFHAGYEAGARSIDPDIVILTAYLSGTDTFAGFGDVPGANEAAMRMYEQGADVIFHAAGTSGLGLFDAAVDFSATSGRDVWAIGVDSDQYETVLTLAGATNAEAWRRHILTSVLKGIDTGTYDVIAGYATNAFRGGTWSQGLRTTSSGISYSGGYIDDLRSAIEDIKARIIARTIVVPCIPVDRLDAAAALGLTPDNCPVATR